MWKKIVEFYPRMIAIYKKFRFSLPLTGSYGRSVELIKDSSFSLRLRI